MSSNLPPDESSQPMGGYPSPEGEPAGPPVGDPLVPVSFGDWWTKVFGVLARSWQSLLVIQLATVLPAIIIGVLIGLGLGTEPTMDPGVLVGALLSTVVLVALALLAQGASVYVAVREATGRPVKAGEALSFAAGRALPLLGWGLLAGIMTVVGILLLVLPGLYLLIVFGAALTGVIMFERRGIGRAFELVNKSFWPTAGRIATFVLAAGLFSWLVEVLVGTFTDPLGGVGSLVINILTLPVTFVTVGVAIVAYAELRNRENRAVTAHVLDNELQAAR